MAEDKVTNLYNAFVKNGYAMEPEVQFRENLKDPKKRKAAYDALVADGYNMEPFADFESNIGFGVPAPQQQAQPTSSTAPASAPALTEEQASAPVQSAPEEPAQPAWQPTEQEKIRMSYQMHTMLNDFNQKSKARLEQIQRLSEPFTPEGRKKRRALEFQAQLAGTPTKVMGLTPPTLAPATEGEQGEAPEGAAEQPVQSGQSPVPYGVKYVDGKPVTQWLLPDGRLTTNYLEADQAEYGARTARLRHQFENRMKQNGLDPAKPEDMEMQAQFDAQVPAYDAVAELWREAEGKHKADKERNANKHWDSYAAMGGGREMRAVTASMNRHDDNISHMTRFDLEKMMDNAWDRVGSQIATNCYNRLRQQYPGASEEELQATASQMARQLTDNAVYQYAVQQNTPKSTLEYFGRTVADMNVINSISKGLARSQAGTSGDLAAYEVAMGEYGKNHRVAQVAGTVVGMAVDPVTWVSGGVGSLAGKGALNLGGRFLASRAAGMTTQMGSRLFGSSLTGRIIVGSAGAAGNLATYEGLKEAESQWLHGGHVNAETGEVEGYSAGEILKSTGHGMLMGSVIGPLSPVIGNVGDKAVRATTSTIGKVGVRGGEIAVSTLAEGTIFSVPQWISGEGDAFDVWTDNMAMMLGFKAQHGIKSAPRVIASLRPIKPTNGRPLTQAERNHNRMDFEERLRKSMDASPNDLAFTADEREELRRAGYGELADLFSRDRVQEVQRPNINPAEGAIELRTERVEAETIHRSPEFDGYSAMEELMQDSRVSQAARAKAYYILTGRMLPMGTVTGYTTTTTEDGRVTISATTADGEIVTTRTFKNEQESKQETDNIMRQAELNSVDVGERFKEAVADDMVLDAAISEVSPGADPATIKRIYRAVKAGNKDVTESQVQLAEFLDDAIARNKDIADKYRPEAIRDELMNETDIDVDAVLRKMPSKRTEAEQEAVKSYLERLFPEEARQQNGEPTPEQAEAQSQYEQGRLLYGRFEEGDPTVQADVDAIALRMQEAYQAVEDVFGAEAEYYMFHVNENSWALVNDPELTAEQQDAVLYYINAKAALDGVMDASNEAADRKRAEVEESVAKRIHKDNGVIIPATMKVDDRPVYIVKGDVVMFPDSSAVDVRNSSESVIVMDAQTGEYEFTSPDQIFQISETVNPQDELDTALSVIEQEQMNVFGDNAVAPTEQPTEEPGNTTQNIPVESNNGAENIPTANVEEYDRGYNDAIEEAKVLTDERLEHYISTLREGAERQQQENGAVDDYIRGRLEAMEFVQQDRAQSVPKTEEIVPNTTENAVAADETAPEAISNDNTALSRIPLNEQGEPMFEQAENPEHGWDALVEFAEGDAATAKEIADTMVEEKRKIYEKAQKQKPKGATPTEILASKKAIATGLTQAEQEYNLWRQMAGVEQRRRAIEEDKARKLAQELADIKRLAEIAEQERVNALKKEAGTGYKPLNEMIELHKDDPEVVSILTDTRPRTLHEVAALLLKGNKLLWNDVTGSNGTVLKRGVRNEAGIGNGEFSKLFGLFANAENGGVGIEALAEDAARSLCEENGIAYDNQEVRNALIDVIRGAGSRGDIDNYIAMSRVAQAERFISDRDRHEQEELEAWSQEEFHASASDLAAREERLINEFEWLSQTPQNEIDAIFAELLNDVSYGNEYRETTGIRQELYEGQERAGGNAQGDEVLPGARIDQDRRSGDSALAGRRGEAETLREGSRSVSAETVSGADEVGAVAADYRGSVGEHLSAEDIAVAENEVNVNPTDAQKEAGNYKKGHIVVDGYKITIEQPKGSIRRGVDVDGRAWESEMHHTYGYIRGTEGVDGDHIDVFLSDTPEEGDVFVVDQVNEDGSFDEHKVMYGFSSEQAAREAYLSNYEQGWTGLGTITHVSKEEFKKWIGSSKRKTKPFANYKSVKPKEDNSMVGRSLSKQEATDLIAKMEANAEVAPAIELTPENWIAQFGEDGMIETPLGIVKMGENQYFKMARQGRESKLGMVRPTLQNPDVVVEDYRPASDGVSERDTSYIFVKTFTKGNGERYYHFTSVTVRKDGREVVISNQERSDKRISKLLQQGEVAWIDSGILHPKAQVRKSVPLNDSSNPTNSDNETARLGVNSSANDESLSLSSERYLTEAPTETEGPDLVPTSDNNIVETPKPIDKTTDTGDNLTDLRGDTALSQTSSVSDGKDNALSADKQGDAAESLSSNHDVVNKLSVERKKARSKDVYEVAKGLVEATGLPVHEVSAEQAQSVTGNQEKPKFMINTYHGTGADFDAFDFSHIGEGEGNQAFGWGGYVSEVEGIGRNYARQIASQPLLDGKPFDHKMKSKDFPSISIETVLRETEGDINKAIARYKYIKDKWDSVPHEDNSRQPVSKEAIAWLEANKDRISMSPRHLYTVEIPDDSGSNYLDWDASLSSDQKSVIAGRATKENLQLDFYGDKVSAFEFFDKMGKDAVGFQTYRALVRALGSDRKASEFLSRAGLTGIKYAADHNNGGNAEGKKNYVLFKESDMRIKDHVRFLKTPDGKVYGWTVGGEVYLNRDATNPETPIHEYTHLWDEMVRRKNPELWLRGKELLRQTQLWDAVVNDSNYADIVSDEDAVASEVHSRLTGEHGAKLLEDIIGNAKKEGVLETAKAFTLVNQLKHWLSDMFKVLKKTFEKWSKRDLKDLTIEDFNRMVLRDLAEGVNPRRSDALREESDDSNVRFRAESKGDFDNGEGAGENKGVRLHVDSPTTGEGNKYRLVEDSVVLDFLDGQPLKSGFRYAQWANMGVLPPMTAKKDGEWRPPMIFSRWEQSEEGMRKENGKADLVQGNGRTTGDVAYNPYFHIRTSPLNDQFTAAYDRPELLVIEGNYPESEETSGYHAEGAKDSVGLMDWHSGSVNGQLSDDTKVQTMLSRYFKPGRIVPWSEVADLIMERVGDQKITFPINAVPPMLRAELAKRGAKFGDISGSVAEADIPMLNELRDRVNAGEWDAGLEKARAYLDAYESSTEAKEARVADLSARANTPVRIVRTQEEADALPTRRERRAKGWWSAKDDEVVIVLPNNVNVADVDNTFVHEVVGHRGLRALIGEERFDEFLGEIYDHASNPIRKVIDKMTDRMVNEEADRLRVRKAQVHERAGEDVNANYYTDMAEVRVEAEKKREDFRKEATEEYMSDLGGRIGSEGFEKMSRDELTLWGKIKAKVQSFLDKFLRGLKIAKSIRLNDKDLSYILYKSWKNLREKQGKGGVFADAEDAVMRRQTGWDDAMLSESAKIDDANNYFNRQLKRYINGDMNKNEMLHLGMPLGVMSQFLPELPIIMRQRVIRKGSEKKHEVDVESIMNMPQYLSSPIFVFQRSMGTIGVLTDMQDRNGKNVCVAIELKRQIQNCRECLEINDVRSFHGREFKNIVEPIVNNNTLKWVDKEKGLAYLSSASQPVQQEIDKEVLDSAAKVIKTFENPTFDGDEDLKFRDGADYVERVPVMARAMYEKQIQSSMYQFTEAMQDSMRGLMEFYKAVESQGAKRDIENVASFENAYIAENLMSSKSYAEMEEYEHRIMSPLLDIAARMSVNKRGRDELIDYMMAKHGLERNAHMRNEAIVNGEESERDFAGLCGLTGEQDWRDAETAAQQIVNDYEAAHSADIADFWSAISKATKTSLKKVYDCGLMGKEQYEKIRDMYDYYIPLRGFDEKTSDDVYGYLTCKGGTFSSPIKKAEGRKSKADDPLATIAYMAQNSIIQGNRNVMKQKFLTYVQNHPSDLASVNRLWLVHDETVDTWKPVFADVDENMTPDEIDKAVMDFEQRMESLSQSEPDKFKRGRDAIGIPYRMVDGNIKEHQVLVKRNGESFVITINGNPRAAQAVNGLTNPDNDLNGAVGKVFNMASVVNRWLAQVYTTLNPDFSAANFIRDLIYSNTMVHIKEDQGYAMKFHKNHAKVNPIRMVRLLHLYEANKLNMRNPIHRMFYEFMHWGGETGYTMQRELEQEKKLVAKIMKEARRGTLNPMSVLSLVGNKLDQVIRGVENSARFAAFVTSRESGRDVQRSVYDAKEISVNFNKKGAGSKFMDAKGQTVVGKTAGFTSGLGRSFYVFWNAAVQGTANSSKAFQKHPSRAIMATTVLVLLGFVIAALSDDDDDETKNGYYNVPKYTRRSNLMFRSGEQWITIPLPVEYRALYGLGELAYGVTSGREEYSNAELAKETASQLSQLMPLDFMEGGGGLHAFVPSAFKPLVESATNTSWTGLPIYKDTPFNKDMPEWTKVYPRANAQLIDLSKWVNEASGGNDYKAGWANFNPGQLEYLLNGYFGGYSNVVNKMVKTGETLFGEREYDPNNILLVNRLVKMGDERTAEKKLNSDFFQYLEEYKRTHTLLRKYEDEADRGVDKYRIFLDALKQSRDGARHDVMNEYIADYNWLNKAIKAPDITDEERMSYEDEMRRLKRYVVSMVKAAHDSVQVNKIREQFIEEYTQQ